MMSSRGYAPAARRSPTARVSSCAGARRRPSRVSPSTASGSALAPTPSAWTCSRSFAPAASPLSRRPAPGTLGQRRASSIVGAEALRRPDLGRIECGATADIVIVDASKPHLQPINDPIRTLVWYASSADVDTVVVNGRPIVRGGRLSGLDEQAIIRRGAAATRRVWEEARRRGHFPIEAAPVRA